MGTINGVLDDVFIVMPTSRLIVKRKISILSTHLHELDTKIPMGNKKSVAQKTSS